MNYHWISINYHWILLNSIQWLYMIDLKNLSVRGTVDLTTLRESSENISWAVGKCVYIYICIYIYMYIIIYIYIYVYVYLYIYISFACITNVRVYIYIYMLAPPQNRRFWELAHLIYLMIWFLQVCFFNIFYNIWYLYITFRICSNMIRGIDGLKLCYLFFYNRV